MDTDVPVELLEQMAALMDGRLPEPERTRLLERIAESEELYALLVEATELLGEGGADGTSGSGGGPAADPPVADPPRPPLAEGPGDRGSGGGGGENGPATSPHRGRSSDAGTPDPDRRTGGWWLARAGGLLAAGLAAILLWGPTGPPPDPIHAYVAAVPVSGGIGPATSPQQIWPATRGPGGSGDPSQGVRMGAWLFHLSWAAASGDTLALRAAANELSLLAEAIPGGGALSAGFRALPEGPAADRGEAVDDLMEAVRARAGSGVVDLGAWLAAVRVEGLSGRAELSTQLRSGPPWPDGMVGDSAARLGVDSLRTGLTGSDPMSPEERAARATRLLRALSP